MSGLVIIPAPIADAGLLDITDHTKSSIIDIRHFVVENLRTARRLLRKYGYEASFDNETQFFEYDKHNKSLSLHEVESWFKAGFKVGLMSEAGMPCIADPGSEIVRLAHNLNIVITVLSGPSSIFMALVSSGFNGQSFAFNGYLPIDLGERIKMLKSLESRVISYNQTQLFMETPYRNQGLFDLILNTCSPNLALHISANIGGLNSIIQTKKISEWKNVRSPDLHKLPTIFALGR